jgi:hypothetical protein
MWCYNGVGILPVSLEDPIVAMYLIHGNYNSREPGMLPFFSAVRKFFDPEEQVLVGFPEPIL